MKHLTKYIALVLLILVAGSVKGALCSQIKGDTISVELTLNACHTVPVSCVPSERIGGAQNGAGNIPIDCSECIDLSFEEILTTVTQRSSSDFDFTPSLDLCCQHMTDFQNLGILDLPFIPDLIIRSDLNLHQSVPSTVLII